MTDNKESQDWRLKLNDLVQTCQSELKKTTQIGLKMISASQSNIQLHEIYENLGKWLMAEVVSGRIKIEDEKIEELISRVKDLESELEGFEKDVRCRTIGDITCTGVTLSKANTLEDIIQETAATRVTERGGRYDDKRSEAAMEDRKKEGYF